MSKSGNLDFLLGGGELGERMRELDWSTTALGPAEHWPRSLKTAVRIMLTSRQAMWIGWGPELIYLYNDPYKSIIGGKHPAALGQPTAVVWREIWRDIGPRIERVMTSNEGTYDEALLLVMERYGYPEETYYTFSYSPIPDDDGGVGGLLCANTEETHRVVRERQIALLRRLATDTANARTLHEAATLSAESLATNPYDFPFAAIYRIEQGDRVVLAGTAGIDANHPAIPVEATINESGRWPFARAIGSGEPVPIDLRDFSADFPCGAWERPPTLGIAVPIAASGRSGSAGVLIAALSPLRLFDEAYRELILLVTSQIAASLGNAQAYEEERHRAEILAQIDRAKTLFFTNISHELRTPLTLMLGPVEEILGKPAGVVPLEARELLDVVHRHSLRLLELVNALLDFSRIEAGRMQASYEPTDFALLTTELSSMFRSTFEKAGLRFIVDAPDLGQPVHVDRGMWEKIVTNLLSNAFKFTLEGEIEVRLRRNENAAVLTVRDTGSGIPDSELPRIFERFHRVEETPRRTHEGTGIGLALLQELVKLHGGTVGVTSTMGEGTTFTVTIPLGTAHLPQDRLVARAAAIAMTRSARVQEAQSWLTKEVVDVAPQASDTTPRIVLADDNADMRDYVRRLLSTRFSVEATADGLEALEAIRRMPPDLVLTDVMMPVMDGFQLLAEIRNDPVLRDLPVVMLSARAGEEAKIEGASAGADDYLVKPFSANELLARVSVHLEMARVRREASARLREQEARSRLALDIARLGTWSVDPADDSVIVDARTREIGGFDPVASLTLATVEPHIHVEDWPEVESLLRSALDPRGDGTYATELRFVHADGSVRWASARGQTIFRGEGESRRPVMVLGTLLDVTERRLAQEQLEQMLVREQEAREEAEIANRAKDDFLATVSHELRTPLTAVLGWAAMLRMTAQDPETARGLEAIEQSAKTQARLVEDILDFSRMRSGRLRLVVRPLPLNGIVADAVASLRHAAAAKHLTMTSEIEDVGEVKGDADRLQQVLWNLLSNAIKFTSDGGSVAARLVRATVDGRAVAKLTITDSGVGISREFLPHVFDAFSQADSSSSRRYSGLGLGLSITRHVVESHGGTIAAESAGPGQGATFTVTLPLVAESIATPSSRPANASASSLGGMRVLVVDDEAETISMVVALLEHGGATVLTAMNAPAAFEIVQREPLDVIVSDIAMAPEDGLSLIGRVRAAEQGRSRLAAIAMTAYARSEDRHRALDAGFDRFLAKPITPEELLQMVAGLMAERRAQNA